MLQNPDHRDDDDEDGQPEEPPEPYQSVYGSLVYRRDVCCSCWRWRRGNEIEDFYRSSGAGRSNLLKDQFCQHDGTGKPEVDGTADRLWGWRDETLDATGHEMAMSNVAKRMLTRLDEIVEEDVDVRAGISEAVERKRRPEYQSQDELCLMWAIAAALDDADVEVSR